uniref:Uncharacterized protein n=1 Tax=viral metagenome TaxID=1070528 RepID=A0A6C0F455_9ZZZZ
MQSLQRSYEAKLATYNTLVSENNPAKLTEIQTLNGELAALLHSMLAEVAKVKTKAENLNGYKDELLQQLVSMQTDASIMREQKDQYIALEMLRSNQQVNFDTSFRWYALALGIAALLFLIVLMWKGGHAMPTMPTTMSSPMTMADFT